MTLQLFCLSRVTQWTSSPGDAPFYRANLPQCTFIKALNNLSLPDPAPPFLLTRHKVKHSLIGLNVSSCLTDGKWLFVHWHLLIFSKYYSYDMEATGLYQMGSGWPMCIGRYCTSHKLCFSESCMHDISVQRLIITTFDVDKLSSNEVFGIFLPQSHASQNHHRHLGKLAALFVVS